MDVIIPAHNIKTLSNALNALGKIGKFLYLEFDPLTGLTLRTLNDAKSSFAEFTFDVGFFERCSSSVTAENMNLSVFHDGRRHGKKIKKNYSNAAVAAGGDGGCGVGSHGDHTRKRRKRAEATSSRSRGPGGVEAKYSNPSLSSSQPAEKYLCRVPIRTVSSLLHSRKGAQSLRIRSTAFSPPPPSSSLTDASSSPPCSEDDSSSCCPKDAKMQLSFEFRIQNSAGQGTMLVTHRVFVSQSLSVIASASRKHCSEIVVNPVLWMKLMDPVPSPEMALIVSDVEKRVIASSFHYAEGGAGVVSNNGSGSGGRGGDDGDGEEKKHGGGNGGGGGGNLVLSARASRVLKTETSVHCDEFDEFVYSGGDSGDIFDQEENDNDEDENDVPPPEGIDRQAVLVFSSKEAKAMVQFCVQQAGGNNMDDLVLGEELRLIVSFHWGGRPILFETEGDAFQGTLILSTVHHGLLKGVVNWSTKSRKSGGRNKG